MARVLATVYVFAAVVTAGLVPGIWAGRWSAPVASDGIGSRLFDVPRTVGEWDGRDLPVNPREQEIAQASDLLRRRFVNTRTGSVVTVTILCGRSGPIAVHTPDVCYKGSGYEDLGTPVRYEVPSAPGNQFWVRRFQKGSAAPIYLRVLYGWTAAGNWEAPDNPRLTFAGRPLLYKLYVTRELSRPDEPLDGDPAEDLMRHLVKPIRAALFPAA